MSSLSVKSLFLVLIIISTSIAKKCDDCVPIMSCKEVKDNISPTWLTANAQKLRSSYCKTNFFSKGTQICCSDFAPTSSPPPMTPSSSTNDDFIPETKSRITEIHTAPETSNSVPSIEDHPNLKLLPDSCGFQDEFRLVGGEKAGLYEFPWMALISYITDSGFQFMCSGTLINKRYVLTAAHCISRDEIAGVRIGEYDIRYQMDCVNDVCESNIQDIRVENITIHEKYTGHPHMENDIALIRLQDPVDLKRRNADTICLPVTQELRDATKANRIATVAGWGLTEFGRDSSFLRKVHLPVHTDSSCQEHYEHVRPTQFCAGTKDRDSCRGDSGGPLMLPGGISNVARYIQYGIVSQGPINCGTNVPGIYTDVTKYMDWILDHIHA